MFFLQPKQKPNISPNIKAIAFFDVITSKAGEFLGITITYKIFLDFCFKK